MDLNRIAALAIIAGGFLVAVGVGFWDWRAGVSVAGVLLIVGGVQSLRSSDG